MQLAPGDVIDQPAVERDIADPLRGPPLAGRRAGARPDATGAPRPARVRAGDAPRPAGQAGPAARPGWCARPPPTGAAAPPPRPDGPRPRRRSAPRSGARPEATELSPTILNRPISPVRRTCVPPHSSTENGSPVVVALVAAHRDDAHLVAVFLAEQRRARPRPPRAPGSAGGCAPRRCRGCGR